MGNEKNLELLPSVSCGVAASLRSPAGAAADPLQPTAVEAATIAIAGVADDGSPSMPANSCTIAALPNVSSSPQKGARIRSAGW